MKENPNFVERLREEELRLVACLAAIRATIETYSVPSMITEAMSGAQQRKTARAAKPARRSVEKKPRKKRAEITEAVRSEVIRQKLLPEAERPSNPQIAKALGIADTSVQRIWKDYRAAQPVAASA